MNDRIRISDADREQVAARLREHFAEGRINSDELDERISAVFAAKTYGDLRHVLADLPDDAPSAPMAPRPGQAGPWGGPQWAVHRRRGPRLLPLMLLALIAAVVIPGAGWVFLAFFQFLLVAGLVATVAMVFAAARFRRRIRRYWQSGATSYWHPSTEPGHPGW
ncbi:MAG TPA: DUF1707 domain-containing protein [Streptosporangiaceae bacterium]|jgi:hypothetical protein|nr:DUF1707 domain-containing protein [Streptosporangiaceae bacterium]